MIAAPRFCTVGMKSFSSQSWSPTTSAAFCRRPRRGTGRGTGSRSGCPRSSSLRISVTLTPVLCASWAIARLWSRRVIAEKRSRGMSGALLIAISALVLAGLPVTVIRMSSAACVVERLALGGEDRAVGLEQVAALHALGAGAGADQQRDVGAVEDAVRRRRRSRHRRASGRRSRRAPSRRPRGAFSAGVISSSRSSTGRVRAEQRAAGDAEEQAVADLAGGAGDGDLDGSSAHGLTLQARCMTTPATVAASRHPGRRGACGARAVAARAATAASGSRGRTRWPGPRACG